METDAVLPLITLLRSRVLQEFRPDSCIITCRAAQQLLRAVGVETKPLTVAAVAYNRRWKERADAGLNPLEVPDAWAVSIGASETVVKHLILYNADALIDPSLDQASRPIHDMNLPPSVFPMDPEHYEALIAGRPISYWSDPNEVGVTYVGKIGDRGYTRSPNWGRECRAITDRIVGDTIRAWREAS